jgi:hypothetical protein
MSETSDECVQDSSNGKVLSNRHVVVSQFLLPLLNHGEMARIFAAKQITLEKARMNSSPVKLGSHE